MEKNYWLEVATKCLEKALEILNYKNGVIGEDADAAKTLIEAALAIDKADHEWKGIEYAGDPSERMLFGLEKLASK